jgi:hypothetical protein
MLRPNDLENYGYDTNVGRFDYFEIPLLASLTI